MIIGDLGMRISELIYECVRDSIQLSNNGDFNYFSFLKGSYNDVKDYKMQISNVLGSTNLALARLSDCNKIPFSTEEIEVDSDEFVFKKGSVINILYNGENVAFRHLDKGQLIKLQMAVREPKKILVEYKPYIKHIKEDDIYVIDDNDIQYNENDFDLFETYGINDTHCAYIKEFVKGQLYEVLDPELANMHNNRAEQYFSLLNVETTANYQKKIKIARWW